jgi:hypothetical protein
MWTPEMETVARWVAHNTPRKAVFISPGMDFDVLVQLAGKVSYIQNERAVSLSGFDVAGRVAEVEQFLEESDSLTLCKKVGYVLNGDQGRTLDHWGRGNWTKLLTMEKHALLKREI